MKIFRYRLRTLLLIPVLIAGFFGGESAYNRFLEDRYAQELEKAEEVRRIVQKMGQ